MTTYFGILTKVGEAKEANAKALGVPVKIAEMEVGDGGGVLPVPDRERTSLIGSKHRAPINRIFVDPNNPAWLVVEQVIPEQFGGWWARELGLRDADGDLIAVSNCPPTYKPQMAEGPRARRWCAWCYRFPAPAISRSRLIPPWCWPRASTSMRKPQSAWAKMKRRRPPRSWRLRVNFRYPAPRRRHPSP